jgi:hypothetical protein
MMMTLMISNRKNEKSQMMNTLILLGVLSATMVNAIWSVEQNALLRSVRRVHLVDQNSTSGNFLFRGASPNVAHGNTFDIRALRSALYQAASNSGVSLPSSFQIVDVNLLNMAQGSFDEGETISEWTHFNDNPQDGQFIFWQTLGTQSNATDPTVPAAMRKYLSSTFPAWTNDDLDTRVYALKALLDRPASQPLVIYFHCDEGCDRTGETAGAYRMRIHGQSWSTINQLNSQECGRPQMCTWYMMMQWYCLWLNNNSPSCLPNIQCTP